MRYVALLLFILGLLCLGIGFGLENCTQGATDGIRGGIYLVWLFGAISFLLLYLDAKKLKRLSLLAYSLLVLICLYYIYLGFDIGLAGGDYYYCGPNGWTVSMMSEIYPETAWYGWIILAAGLSGLVGIRCLWKMEKSGSPKSPA